jgi:hypothetical protein
MTELACRYERHAAEYYQEKFAVRQLLLMYRSGNTNLVANDEWEHFQTDSVLNYMATKARFAQSARELQLLEVSAYNAFTIHLPLSDNLYPTRRHIDVMSARASDSAFED